MSEQTEPKVNINGKEYNLSDLSDEAKNQLKSLRATDLEIQRLNNQLGIAQTAKNAYAQAFKMAMDKMDKDA